MTSKSVFPPPPPPPPVGIQGPSPAAYGNPAGNWNSSRGRGRGGGSRGQRGGNRGGHGNTWNALSYAHGASSSGYSYQQRHGFSNNNVTQNYNSHYAPSHSQAGQQWQTNYGQNSLSAYPPPNSYPPYPTQSYPNSTIPNSTYGHHACGVGTSMPQLNQQAKQNSAPISMGPPIRMGFKDAGNGAYSISPNQSYEAKNTHYKIDNRPQSNGRGRGQKRQFGEAFGHKDVKPKPLTAPAVPSFGGPIDLHTVTRQEKPQPKKKKREHNQLGLTPHGEDLELSEDDADEEARLAASLNQGGGSQPMYSFSYRGKMSTLNSAEEIAAWIADRRKRFPTKLRIAEFKAQRTLQQEKARQAKEQQAKERREQEEERKKTAQEKKRKKRKRKKSGDETSAQAEAEELRKTLEKTQKRLAELEAKAKKSHQKASEDDAKSKNVDASKERACASISQHEDPSRSAEVPAPTTGSNITSSIAGKECEAKQIERSRRQPHPIVDPDNPELHSDTDSLCSLPSTSPSDLELEDSTSSADLSSTDSESSLSSSGDTDSDSNSTTTSSSIPSRPSTSHKARSPSVTKAPTRKALCRYFLKAGKCWRKGCRFRHRFTDKEEETKHGKGKMGKGRGRAEPGDEDKNKELSWEDRPSLYQRLLKQQLAEEEAETKVKEEERQNREQEAQARAKEEGKGGREKDAETMPSNNALAQPRYPNDENVRELVSPL